MQVKYSDNSRQTVTVEITDTFGGEANYSWVNRHTFATAGMTDKQVERKARALVGLTGVSTRRTDYGDMVRWDVSGACICAFLSTDY
jgi:hypothetical protein